MDLLYLIDRLEEQVAGAQRMPLGNRAVVDRRALLDTIDQLRVAVPAEVREAREIVAEMDAIRRNTEEEARLVLARAEEQAASLVDDHKVTRAARERAAEIVAEGETRAEERSDGANAEMAGRIEESRAVAQQQMAAADEYARRLLTKLESQLGSFQRSVQSGLDQLTEEPAEGAMQPTVTPDQMDEFLADAGAAPRSLLEAARREVGAPDPAAVGPIHFAGAPAAEAAPEADLPAAEPEEGVIDDFAMPPLDDERAPVDVIEEPSEPPADEQPADEEPGPVEEREPALGTIATTPSNGSA
ncbi:MAG: hypothetical protein OXG95_08475 [Chloroflexi bacterium]|nr:hypothetical protein [Chloroflexota bacterium]